LCGITGHLNWNGAVDKGGIVDMVIRLHHRGPDNSDIWCSPEGLCVLGHARLSVIDLTKAGHQPMLDPVTGNAIVFNGEIYNFKKLRTECEAKGDRFFSNTDTEVILALYRRHGIGCLRYLRGMFAFAIWDKAKQQLFLARDRVGKKPLNYALTSRGFFFSSEIFPLASHTAVNDEIDIEALELYLQLQYIPAPWTICRGIRKLPPAHFAIFDRKGLSVEQYWDVDYRPKLKMTEQEALDGLEEKLREAVRLRMISDVPLGALLSGGVDSSLMVALMSGLSTDPVKTFSIGFEEEAFNELPYAQIVADQYKTDHRPETLHGEVESILPRIVKHYGEPYADKSAIPSFYVCGRACRYVTVVINGDGGDELLGGYPRYWLSPVSIVAAQALGNLTPVETLTRLGPSIVRGRSLTAKARRKLFTRFLNPELQSLNNMYSGFWNDRDRNSLLDRDTNYISPVLHKWRLGWLGKSRYTSNNPIDRMLWIDNRTYLPGDLLVKMDIASMHCSLEARSPLLDHEVIEYCASLPVRFKVRRRSGKYLLKKLAERYLPKDLIYRPKMGFAIPLEDWLKGPLKIMTQDILGNPELMYPLNTRFIRQIMQEFFEQGVDHKSRIWALLMFGKWNELRLEAISN